MTPGPMQILIVILLLLVVFGAGRVPLIAENMAKGIKAFKRGLKDDDDTPSKTIADQSNKDS